MNMQYEDMRRLQEGELGEEFTNVEEVTMHDGIQLEEGMTETFVPNIKDKEPNPEDNLEN